MILMSVCRPLPLSVALTDRMPLASMSNLTSICRATANGTSEIWQYQLDHSQHIGWQGLGMPFRGTCLQFTASISATSLTMDRSKHSRVCALFFEILCANGHLRDAAGRCGDAIQAEVAERLVVPHKLTLALQQCNSVHSGKHPRRTAAPSTIK